MHAYLTSSSSTLQRWFFVGLLLLFVVISAQYTAKVWDEQNHQRSAFLRWRSQILELNDGVNIWQKHNYPNPPIMVMLLKILVPLHPVIGSLIWYYLKVAMTLVAMCIMFRLVETPGQPWPIWAKAAAVVLSLRPIIGDLTHGNVNLFILLLVVAALAFYRAKRGGLAGLSLALAIACKVTPALFIPYFVWKRAWSTVAGCGVGLVLFFWIVPGLFFGFGPNAEYLSAWRIAMIEPYAVRGEVTTEYENQSLPGLVHRMLTDSASFSTFSFEGGRYITDESHNFVSWPPFVARCIVRGCMAVFVLVVVCVCRQPTDQRERWQLAAEYGLILVGMLLFSERTWKHHCVTLLIPFGVLVYYLATGNPGPRMKRFVVVTLVLAGLLMMSTGTGWGKDMSRWGKLAQVYGAYVWVNLLLAGALAFVLYKHRVSAPSPELSTVRGPFRCFSHTALVAEPARFTLQLHPPQETAS
jgi:hypothetical protein